MDNYFSLFNLPLQFNIDLKQLKAGYLQQQALTHPDRFVSANSQQQRIAMQRNTTLNQAYQTLSSPIARAAYMQSLCGNSNIERHINTDIEFLAQQIELREMMENSHNTTELTPLKVQLTTNIEDCLNDFSTAYDTQNYLQSQQQLDRAMFFDKCLIELQRKLRLIA